MAHDWVFDVLDDLSSYATANGLTALAAKVEEARDVAAVEIGALPQGTLVPRRHDPGN